MDSLSLSFLSRSCLLALAAHGTTPAIAAVVSSWHVTDGSVVDVTSGYTATSARDYPLFASGEGSQLQTALPGLSFRTTGNLLYAAYVRDEGSIYLNGASLMTDGTLAHGANSDGGTLNINESSITVSGEHSAGVIGSNGANVSLSNLGIAADSKSGTGITLSDGTLNVSDTTLVLTGEGSRGIALAYSTSGEAQATLDKVNIFLRCKGTQAGIMLGNGQVDAGTVNIFSHEDNRGIEIYNSGGGHGSLQLDNSIISTDQGDGIYILGGDATLTNTTINTQGGVAINVNKTARVAITGGSFTTQDSHADALWIGTADSSAEVTGSAFTTHGSASHAFNAQFGSAALLDSQLSTHGMGSYGLYSESEVQANNSVINTQGDNGVGIFAARGGIINIYHSAITTAGNGAAALLTYPGSTINGDGHMG
jgi:hypothetical protein